MKRLLTVALLLFVASCAALAQSPPKPVPKGTRDTDRAQAEQDKRNKELIQPIVEQLQAIQEQIKQNSAEAQNRANQKSPGGPPVWSNWILALVAIGGAGVAYRAFISQRNAVWATESADVLVEALSMTHVRQDGLPSPSSVVVLKVRNYGRTRAIKLKCYVRVGTAKTLAYPTEPPRRGMFLGANEFHNFEFNPLIELTTAEECTRVCGGETDLLVDGTILYTDVFGRTHEIDVRSRYRPEDIRFSVEHSENEGHRPEGERQP